jgi:alkylation response protein AidB-like acyl-CoA dehydrogenase
MSLQIDDHYQELFQMLNTHELNEDDLQDSWYRFKLCSDSGLLLHAIPSLYGGNGDTFHTLCKAYEALGFFTRDPGLIISLQAHLWGIVFPIILYGTEEQKQKYIPSLIEGETIGGYAITEPDTGGGVTGLNATATKTSTGYTLNAHKRFITNAPIAKYILVYAYIEKDLCAFIVDVNDDGVEFYDVIATEGLITSPMGDVVLENCTIPEDRLVGSIGEGKAMAKFTREMIRSFIFSGIIGLMKWQLEQVSLYVNQRESNGSRLSTNQSVTHKIAEMRIRLDTMKLWIKRCAYLKDNNEAITLNSAQAKIYCSDAFLQSSLDTVQLMGAMGLSPHHYFIQWIEDALALRMLSGPDEIHKNLIAKHLGLNQ